MRLRFFLILSIFLFISSIAYSQVGVDIDVEFGFNGMVKTGRWNPITVNIRTYSVPFKGRIEIEIKEGSVILENITTVVLKSDVDIPIYSKREYLFLVPLSDVRHPVKVSVFSQEGRLVKALKYEIKELDMRLPIICLIDNWTLPYRGESRVLSLESERLLDKPVLILDPFDIVSLSPVSFHRLKDLLDKWIVLGGKVLTDSSISVVKFRQDTYPGDIDLSPLVLDLLKEQDVPLPSKMFISLILFLYVLLIFLFLYYSKGHFLKKIGIYILIGFAFSYLLFSLTLRTKEGSDIGVQVNLVKVNKNSPYANFYSGLAVFSPYNRGWSFLYNSRDLVFWISRREKRVAETNFNNKDKDKTLVEIDLGPNKFGLLKGLGVLDFGIKIYRDKDNITVINNSSYTLHNVYFLSSKGYLPLDDIKVGTNRFLIELSRLSRLSREDIKERILSWLIDNGIILLGEKNYILGWIYTTPVNIEFKSKNIKILTLCLLEV
ncbi:MAG: hypothetical protein N2380_06305 [bacterium]|nr:hypothetical protein [bacterium]